MPKGTAAKILARDARKHRESRKFKVKVYRDLMVNENEILRMRTAKRKELKKQNKGETKMKNKGVITS